MSQTLITRLSKLDAPDREADAEIYIRFNIPAERAGRIDYSNGMVGWWPKDGPYVSAVTVPAYTASIDAVIALAERVLPGKARKIVWQEGKAIVVISQAARLHVVAPTIVQTHSSAAIAACIAILRAKEASKP
nr:hypothetical protein [Brucella intermedia]